MGRDRAAYMRDYRARQRAKRAEDVYHVLDDLERMKPRSGSDFAAHRIAELEEDVRHLKAELAKRPRPFSPEVMAQTFNSRPFTPVPKQRARSPR
jgi:hypothetical protein